MYLAYSTNNNCVYKFCVTVVSHNSEHTLVDACVVGVTAVPSLWQHVSNLAVALVSNIPVGCHVTCQQ